MIDFMKMLASLDLERFRVMALANGMARAKVFINNFISGPVSTRRFKLFSVRRFQFISVGVFQSIVVIILQ
jgi:hypothetical protein